MKLLIFNTITISSTGAGYTLHQLSLLFESKSDDEA